MNDRAFLHCVCNCRKALIYILNLKLESHSYTISPKISLLSHHYNRLIILLELFKRYVFLIINLPMNSLWDSVNKVSTYLLMWKNKCVLEKVLGTSVYQKNFSIGTKDSLGYH